MSEYKLTYFDLGALGEPIRWIFKLKSVEFEDERIGFGEFDDNKARFPLGQMPMLVEDGVEMTQSMAIARYLGKKFDLANTDPWLDYRCDQVASIIEDARLNWKNRFAMENDEEKKEEGRKDLLENFFPKALKQLEDIVSCTDGDYITGENVTWADLWVVHHLSMFSNNMESPDLLSDYPALTKLSETVKELPGIKEWIEERPQVDLY